VIIMRDPTDTLAVVLSARSVLRVQARGPTVTSDQLRRLIDVAERSNVMSQVLPFTILESPKAADDLIGSPLLESEGEVRRYTVVLDHLRAEALG
jgi:hypothetical protein